LKKNSLSLIIKYILLLVIIFQKLSTSETKYSTYDFYIMNNTTITTNTNFVYPCEYTTSDYINYSINIYEILICYNKISSKFISCSGWKYERYDLDNTLLNNYNGITTGKINIFLITNYLSNVK